MPVTVHFPIGTRVAEEALLESERKPPRDLPSIGTDAVDHAAPIAPSPSSPWRGGGASATARDEALAERDVLADRSKAARRGVRLRQQVPPRHGVDRTAMAGGFQNDKVDHGQTGAADQHGAVQDGCPTPPGSPRIDVAGRPPRRRAPPLDGREHRDLAGEAAARASRVTRARSGSRRCAASPLTIWMDRGSSGGPR